MPIGVIEEISRRGAEEVSVEWRIPNFPSLLHGREVFCDSPEFRFGDECWRLIMWPNWERKARNPASGWVRVGLERMYTDTLSTFRYSVGIKGSGGVENIREGEKDVKGYGCFLWYDFCSRSYLLEHRTRLMPDDTFTVSCVLKRPGTAGGIEKVVEDIGKLLVSGDDSDVTVQVGDVEFKAHRLILSARCPVLAAMFRHETAERVSNRITISDCQPEVFRDFLHYLYRGSAHHLSTENVFELYRVSDKYLADDLKQQCLQHVRDTLSVQTFCDAVQLALTYAQSGLLEQAMNFATKNIRSIIRTVEWQNFNRDHPTEATEILIKALDPSS